MGGGISATTCRKRHLGHGHGRGKKKNFLRKIIHGYPQYKFKLFRSGCLKITKQITTWHRIKCSIANPSIFGHGTYIRW